MRVPCMKSPTDIVLGDIYVYPSVLIPARSHDGLITGLLTKLHSSVKGPKYKYMDRSFFLYPDRVDKPQTWPEYEEPMFVVEAGGGVHKSVALVEGALITHVLAAQLKARKADLHSHVIGIGGGQFWQSPSSLCHALAGMQPDKVVLYADAGSTLNTGVLLAYFRTFEMLQEFGGVLGFDVAVAWWGQGSKDDLDVDDFLNDGGDLSLIQQLSIQDFWSKVPEKIQTQLVSSKKKGAVYRRVLAREASTATPEMIE